MDYNSILKLWDKNKCFVIENNRIKPKKYIYTPFFRANSNGFNNLDIRRLISSDVMARFYRHTYNNVLFPTGYNTLANTAFIENKRLSDITDNVSDIFNAQMLRLGIGINQNKDINMNSNEYLSLLQQSFIDLYKKGYIKYDYCSCFYDKTNNKIFDRINKPSELPATNLKSFYLDISSIIDRLVNKIFNIDLEIDIKNKMIDFLDPKSFLSITLSISTGEELNIKMEEPETLGGVSYILINPEHIDVTNFIEPSEEESVISFLNDNNSNDVVFTGVFAKNPLTGEDIPIFISLLYNEPYHLGIPGVDLDDRDFALTNDLDIIEILEDGILVQSDFISGYDRLTAREMIIEAFVDAEIASSDNVYDHSKILISSLDNYGALFPFLEEKDQDKIHSLEGYLPYRISERLRAELDSSCDIVGSTMSGTINNLYIEGINPILAILYDDIGFITSIFSNDAKVEYLNWNCIDYLCIKESDLIYSLFMQLVFQTILESELDIKFNTANCIVKAKLIVDNKGIEISKKNNNIVDFDKLLKTYTPDAIRLYLLSKPLDEDFTFIDQSLKEMNDITNKIISVLSNNSNSKKLEFMIYNLTKNCKDALDNKDVCRYVDLLLEFFNNDIKGLSDEHALTLAKLIYPICPFISEDVYQKRYNGRYSIVNEDFID